MKQPVISHLEELRKRSISISIFITIFFFIGVFFSNFFINLIKKNLITNLNVSLIALTPLEYLYTLIKIGFLLSIALSFPIIIYHLIKFTKPALTKKEKRLFIGVIPFIILLFIIGFLFGYYIFLKIVLWFLSELTVNANILNLWSISKFISFIFTICFSLGLIFELPILIILLSRLNILTSKQLAKKRKYIIIALFIIAALITPPDALTLLLLVVPLLILFEISILIVKIFERKS